jgi:hypothetical protein
MLRFGDTPDAVLCTVRAMTMTKPSVLTPAVSASPFLGDAANDLADLFTTLP